MLDERTEYPEVLIFHDEGTRTARFTPVTEEARAFLKETVDRLEPDDRLRAGFDGKSLVADMDNNDADYIYQSFVTANFVMFWPETGDSLVITRSQVMAAVRQLPAELRFFIKGTPDDDEPAVM